jgi:heat shock protein HslJ
VGQKGKTAVKLALCVLLIGAVIAATGVLPAFARQASPEASPGDGSGLPETVWYLVEATLADGTVHTPEDPSLYTIQFLPESRVAGRADCNQVAGGYELDGEGGLALTGMLSTLAACPEGSLGSDYTAWLGQVVGYELSEAELVLLLDDGGRLRYVPALGDVTWEWQRFEGGNDEVVIPDRPADYTVRFEPDGGVLVRADCSSGRGRYTVDGSTIDIEAIGLTRMACGENSLGDRYVRDLEEVTSLVFVGGQLVLVLPIDSGVLRFVARASVAGLTTPAAGTPESE